MNDYVVKVIAAGPYFNVQQGFKWVKGFVEIKHEFNLKISAEACPTILTFEVPV